MTLAALITCHPCIARRICTTFCLSLKTLCLASSSVANRLHLAPRQFRFLQFHQEVEVVLETQQQLAVLFLSEAMPVSRVAICRCSSVCRTRRKWQIGLQHMVDRLAVTFCLDAAKPLGLSVMCRSGQMHVFHTHRTCLGSDSVKFACSSRIF